MNETSIDGTSQEKRLYELIWKRTLASQMADALIEKTTITINIDNASEKFIANGEVVSFDGFLKVYLESTTMKSMLRILPTFFQPERRR